MAKTIIEAGGQTQSGVLPTSQEISSAQSVNAKKTQVGDALSKDLFGVMGNTGSTVQQANTASINAAKKVASDSSTELAKSLTLIDKATNYNDPKSIRTAQEANKAAYQEFGRKTFDNEDAQNSFDDSYHTRGALAVAKTNTQLEKGALKLDAQLNYTKVSADTESQMNAGLEFRKEDLDENVKSQTAGGYYSKEDAQYTNADLSTTSFDSKITESPKTILDRAGYDPEVGFTNEVASTLFNDNFGAYGKLEKNGNIKWNKDLENKAKEEILRSWKSFESSMKPKDGTTLDPFKRIKASVTQGTSNATGSYVSSVQQQKQYKQNVETVATISGTQVSTPNQADNMNIKMQEAKNNITITQTIERDLGLGGDIDDKALGYLTDGRAIEMVDVRTGEVTTHKISKERYQTAAKSFIDNASSDALSSELKTSEDIVAYQANVKRVLTLEAITHTKSATTKKYENSTKSGTVQTFSDANELLQLTAYNDVTLQWDKKNEVLNSVNNELKNINADTTLTPTQKVMKSNITLQGSKNNEAKEKQRGDIRKIIDTKIDTQVSGKEFWTFESSIHASVNDAIMTAIYSENKQDIAESYIDEIEERYTDVGSSAFGDKDQRFIRPNGSSESQVKSAITVLLAENKKTTKRHHGMSNIVIQNDYKNGDYVVKVYSKLTGKQIGNDITNKNFNQLAEKDK